MLKCTEKRLSQIAQRIKRKGTKQKLTVNNMEKMNYLNSEICKAVTKIFGVTINSFSYSSVIV